jgi:hypothetical protein
LAHRDKLAQSRGMTSTSIDIARSRTPEKRLSKRIRHACEALISGDARTIKAAATQAGLSREHLSRALREPHVQAFCERRVRENIGVAQMRAVRVLEHLMDNGKSEHVRRDVARYFTELAGYVVRSDVRGPLVNVNVATAPGYVIDLSERGPVYMEAPSDHQSVDPIDRDASNALEDRR